MDRATAEDVVDEFESAYPEAFRAAVYYEVADGDDVTYETLQVREDVRDDSADDGEPAEIVSTIVEDALAEDTGTEWHDRVWDAGPIHYSMWMFGDVSVVHFGREPETRGFLASIDTEMSPFFQRLVEKTLDELGAGENDDADRGTGDAGQESTDADEADDGAGDASSGETVESGSEAG